jgi:hypothetical protein
MRRIADALPSHRFETFIIFARLSPFTAEELALARTLNGPYAHRVILLTDRELEPYHLYERTKETERLVDADAGSLSGMAENTNFMYFGDAAQDQ